jgi:hypothetical protein
MSPCSQCEQASEVPPHTGQSIHRRDAEVAELIHWSSQRSLRLCGESKPDSFAPSFQFQDSRPAPARRHPGKWTLPKGLTPGGSREFRSTAIPIELADLCLIIPKYAGSH